MKGGSLEGDAPGDPMLVARVASLSPVSLLAIAIICAAVGALGQFAYARAGLDLETSLLARIASGGKPLSLGRSVVVAMLLAGLGLPLAAALLHLALQAMNAARRPLLVTYRLSVCAGIVAVLAKLVPWVGYFLGLTAGIVLQYRWVRRAHRASPGTAALALILSTAAVLAAVGAVVAAAGSLSRLG